MNKIFIAVFLLALFQVNSQRPEHFPDSPPRPHPRPVQNQDFTQCFNGLSLLEPYIATLLDTVDTATKEDIIKVLKEFFGQFKQAAEDCGIVIPETQIRGDSEKCDQDIVFLTSVLKEVKNQAQKSPEDQNIIAIITTFMGLANQLPRALQDCAV